MESKYFLLCAVDGYNVKHLFSTMWRVIMYSTVHVCSTKWRGIM